MPVTSLEEEKFFECDVTKKPCATPRDTPSIAAKKKKQKKEQRNFKKENWLFLGKHYYIAVKFKKQHWLCSGWRDPTKQSSTTLLLPHRSLIMMYLMAIFKITEKKLWSLFPYFYLFTFISLFPHTHHNLSDDLELTLQWIRLNSLLTSYIIYKFVIIWKKMREKHDFFL